MSVEGKTFKQLQCLKPGAEFKLVAGSKPELQADQILFRQSVIGLNRLDLVQSQKGLFIRSWPCILGIEGAGVVEEVGSSVTSLKPGDEVFAYTLNTDPDETWGGSFQEALAVPVSRVAKRPASISMHEAASLVIGYVTACAALFKLGLRLPHVETASPQEPAPRSVLVLGGSSVCGAATIQLLRLSFPNLPILTTSSARNNAKVQSFGANQVLDYHSKDIINNVLSASPAGNGVDIIIDCVGAGAKETGMAGAFSTTGRRVYAAIATGAAIPTMQDVTFLDIYGREYIEQYDDGAAIPGLTSLIEAGDYKVPLPTKVVAHGLEGIPEVLKLLDSTSGEKLIVTL